MCWAGVCWAALGWAHMICVRFALSSMFFRSQYQLGNQCLDATLTSPRPSRSPSPPPCLVQVDTDDIEGNEVQNGVCGLLYAELQLHTAGRRAAQAVLIQVRRTGGGGVAEGRGM